jgi:wyosine [tRNA(Phe)-imidazoG37] synthetase (radical SAM superfamily)
MSHVYGPVPSRRLGRSLGVDLVPFKACPYDCIYCQLGRTTDVTLDRHDWYPLEDVIDDLKDRIDLKPDYITLGGSGEPTLYAQIGDLIDSIRALTNIPVVVLTNGALLWQPEVRRQLREAAMVIPSLDAGDADMFQAVNRPHESLEFEQVLEGLITFREEYWGRYWLEVMLLQNYTAAESQVRKIAACTDRIRPNRVQINTATRPTAEAFAEAIEPAYLHRIVGLFPCKAEVIGQHASTGIKTSLHDGGTAILDLLRRRPCTVDDIAAALQSHRLEILKYLDELTRKRLIDRRRAGNRVYFCASRRTSPNRQRAASKSEVRH